MGRVYSRGAELAVNVRILAVPKTKASIGEIGLRVLTERGRKVGELRGNGIYDRRNRRVAKFDGRCVRDFGNSRIARIEDVNKRIGGAGGVSGKCSVPGRDKPNRNRIGR